LTILFLPRGVVGTVGRLVRRRRPPLGAPPAGAAAAEATAPERRPNDPGGTA
jgi:hypothetical protein